MAFKTAFVGGKGNGQTLASLASHKPDLRRDISAWGALVWAYADEIVLAASSVGGSNFPAPGLAMSGLGRERISGGLINGFYEPHHDARTIHAKLSDWFSHDGYGLCQVMAHAERRKQLPREIHLPRVKAMPVYDRQGNVLIERRRAHRSGRVITEYCVLEYEGIDPREADRREQAWRDMHGVLMAFLDVMQGFELTKWRVTNRGLTNVCESLTR
jgi:hypothetical protein